MRRDSATEMPEEHKAGGRNIDSTRANRSGGGQRTRLVGQTE